MASLVLTSATVLVGINWTGTAPGEPGTQTVSGTVASSSDISVYTTKVEMPWNAALETFTNFGSGGYLIQKPSIKSSSLNFEFNQDYAASALDVILRTTLGGLGALIYVDIKPTSAARSATNPSYVSQSYLTQYLPVMGSVGGKAVMAISWPVSGKFDVLTS